MLHFLPKLLLLGTADSILLLLLHAFIEIGLNHSFSLGLGLVLFELPLQDQVALRNRFSVRIDDRLRVFQVCLNLSADRLYEVDRLGNLADCLVALFAKDFSEFLFLWRSHQVWVGVVAVL